MATSQTPPVRFAAVFTFLDAVADSGKVWSLKDVENEMKIARSLGVNRIYWRADAGGLFVYPTKVGTPYTWIGTPYSSRLVDSIKAIGDPLRAFAESARRHGIEFYVWYPIRDRNGTSEHYSAKDPAEAEIYQKVGKWPSLSGFLKENPQFNMQRREREEGPAPTVTEIRLKTGKLDQILTEQDVQIWQSDDNLEYEKVEGWDMAANTAGPQRIFSLKGLNIDKKWIKVWSSGVQGGTFSGAGVEDWITVVDKAGREWLPWTWLASEDKNPRFGEARYPYKPASRAEHVRNDKPWDTLSKFQFGPFLHSIALFTPAAQPDPFLLGYPCFAYPEVRAHEIKVIEEFLSYPIDGIAICTRTHVRSVRGEDYGFNPPIVEEYRKRHGVDILQEDFDEEKFREIHGDNFTQMLREISATVHAAGKKLVAMYEPEPELKLEYMPGQMSAWWDIGLMDWQWRKWTKEGLIDELMVFTTGFNLPWDQALQDYLSLVRREASGVPVSLFYDCDYNPERQRASAFRDLVKGALSSPDLAEINVFEFVEFHLPEQQLNRVVKSLELDKTP